MNNEIFSALVVAVIGFIGLLFRQLLAPLIVEKVNELKKKGENAGIDVSKSKIEAVKTLLMPLVESAYRLKLQGKVEDAKERVLSLARIELKKIGIDLSDELLDELRRACLVELEMTLEELTPVIEEEQAAETTK